jgi:deoxyhypusine monooxygenase
MAIASCVIDENETEEIKVIQVSPEKMEELKKQILDDKEPMEKRNRCVFTLCSIKTNESVDALAECLQSSTCSELLKHEIAYVLGQMNNTHAIPILNQTLENTSEAVIVRHEAAEALGAIGQSSSLEVLRKFLDDPSVEIRETCQISIDRILYFDSKSKSNEGKGEEEDEEKFSKQFQSVDPAPSLDSSNQSIPKLKEIMMDTSLSLFERYRALFALRDNGSDKAVEAMIAGFSDSSALFRHEVAFVMGQLQSPFSKDILTKVLCDSSEHEMVRHEAAEALGAISTEETVEILQKYLGDEHGVVRESCSVALDIHEYFHSDQFQYADGLVSDKN